MGAPPHLVERRSLTAGRNDRELMRNKRKKKKERGHIDYLSQYASVLLLVQHLHRGISHPAEELLQLVSGECLVELVVLVCQQICQLHTCDNGKTKSTSEERGGVGKAVAQVQYLSWYCLFSKSTVWHMAKISGSTCRRSSSISRPLCEGTRGGETAIWDGRWADVRRASACASGDGREVSKSCSHPLWKRSKAYRARMAASAKFHASICHLRKSSA